jgi:cytochrome c oxidase assembly factor CtaG
MTMYFTSWYTHVFTSGTVREVTYLILMVPGYVFFWTLLRVDPVPKEYPYGVAMWITAAEVVGDAFFGIAVIADQTILAAPHYHAVGYPYGPSLATSQVLGGGIIWILGDFVGLPFLAVQLIQMMRADKLEAAEIDAELDARDTARAASRAAKASAPPATDDAFPDAVVPVTLKSDGTDEADEADRPWWETDPRLTDRFKRA